MRVSLPVARSITPGEKNHESGVMSETTTRPERLMLDDPNAVSFIEYGSGMRISWSGPPFNGIRNSRSLLFSATVTIRNCPFGSAATDRPGRNFIVLGLVLVLNLGPRYRTWTEAATQKRILQAYLFAPLLLLTIDLLELPVSMYGHRLAVAYDQSIQPWGSWFWDWTKGRLLEFALADVVLWALYAAIRRSRRRWWFWFWLVVLPIIVFLMFIEPLVIQPMFYGFRPLAKEQPALVSKIEEVVARGGLVIPQDRMFEMNASSKLNAVNAYVTGIGISKRVVVWDTTIQKMTTPEVLFVFGHEMGHYMLGHIWLGIGFAAGGILIVLFVAYHGMTWAIARWGGRWGIRGLDDWASLPVLLLGLSILGFSEIRSQTTSAACWSITQTFMVSR